MTGSSARRAAGGGTERGDRSSDESRIERRPAQQGPSHGPAAPHQDLHGRGQRGMDDRPCGDECARDAQPQSWASDGQRGFLGHEEGGDKVGGFS